MAGYLFLEHTWGTPEIRFLSNKSNLLDVIAFLPVSRIRDLTFPGPPHPPFENLLNDIYIYVRASNIYESKGSREYTRHIFLSEMTIEEIKL